MGNLFTVSILHLFLGVLQHHIFTFSPFEISRQMDPYLLPDYDTNGKQSKLQRELNGLGLRCCYLCFEQSSCKECKIVQMYKILNISAIDPDNQQQTTSMQQAVTGQASSRSNKPPPTLPVTKLSFKETQL